MTDSQAKIGLSVALNTPMISVTIQLQYSVSVVENCSVSLIPNTKIT